MRFATSNYLAIESSAIRPSFLISTVSLIGDDIKQLKTVSRANVTSAAHRGDGCVKQSVNWSAPDAENQVNRLGQKMALEAIQQYTQGGNAALGTYMDKHHPAV